MTIKDYIKKIYQNIFYPLKFKKFGKFSYIKSLENLKNPKGISIGSHIYIKSDARLESLGGEIVIGDNCQFEKDVSITCSKKIEIGQGVLFGRNVLLVDHTHNYLDIDVSRVKSGIISTKEIKIGENCWIGANAIILGGTNLAKGTVVGANSVVNTEYDSPVVLAGNPAKIVKIYNEKTKIWGKING